MTPDYKDKVTVENMSEDSIAEENVGKFTLDPIYNQLAKTVFENIVMQQVACGSITYYEIADRTFLNKVVQIFSDEVEIVPIRDHTQAILKKTRKERLRPPDEAVYIMHFKSNIRIKY